MRVYCIREWHEWCQTPNWQVLLAQVRHQRGTDTRQHSSGRSSPNVQNLDAFAKAAKQRFCLITAYLAAGLIIYSPAAVYAECIQLWRQKKEVINYFCFQTEAPGRFSIEKSWVKVVPKIRPQNKEMGEQRVKAYFCWLHALHLKAWNIFHLT